MLSADYRGDHLAVVALLNQLGPAGVRAASARDEFRCPGCRGVVHYRQGSRVRPHFAHASGACAWASEPEGEEHLAGKAAICSLLERCFPDASIQTEVRIPEATRLADVAIRFASGQLWAYEFQCANLEPSEWHRRTTAYQQAGIPVYWVLGGTRCRVSRDRLPAVRRDASFFERRLFGLDALADCVARAQGRLHYLFPDPTDDADAEGMPRAGASARCLAAWRFQTRADRRLTALVGVCALSSLLLQGHRPFTTAEATELQSQGLRSRRVTREDLLRLAAQSSSAAVLFDTAWQLYQDHRVRYRVVHHQPLPSPEGELQRQFESAASALGPVLVDFWSDLTTGFLDGKSFAAFLRGAASTKRAPRRRTH